ncbi:MAG: PKD domain-containing protein [Muribaculaceae bacterium]|nr:PKD domain-containing protein [Muribaculaceae bacterium]
MKLYIKSIALALSAMAASASFTSCTEDKVYDVDFNALPLAADYVDCVNITADESNNVTFEFTGKGVYPIWIIDGKSYSTTPKFTRFYRKAGDYNIEVKVANGNGMSTGTITKSFTLDKTMMSGFGGFAYDSPFNLWTSATKQINSFYYAPDWSQLPDPAHSFDGETVTVTLPTATSDRWQCQMHIGSDICLNEGESYDGSFIFTATKDINDVMLKIHPDGDDDDSHSFFCNQKINLTAGEPVTYWFSDLTAVVPMNNLVFTFDFGRNPEGIEISVENFVIKSHANDDGTVLPELPTTPEPTWVAVDSADNLWSGCSFTTEFFYAPGWNQIGDPGFDLSGKDFTITLPSATGERWQAQCKFHSDIALPADGTTYDFCITFESNVDVVAMVKLTQNGDDNNFLFAEETPLTAGGLNKFWVASAAVGADIPALSLILDFGTNPEGAEIKVSNIILQVHHD